MEKNLPIKIIMPKKTDIIANTGMGKAKFFCEYTPELEKEIVGKFEKLSDYYDEPFAQGVPAIGKIIVKENAIAKSHKPSRLCKNCNIIGGEALNEIYIKVTKESINSTILDIRNSSSEKLQSNLTAIEDIIPITKNDRISYELQEHIKSKEIDSVKARIKIKLFDFGDEYENYKSYDYVVKNLNKIGVHGKNVKYGEKINLLKVEVQSVEQLERIADINGIKTVDFFPLYASITEQKESIEGSINIQEGKNVETIIGIIDGGISPSNQYLRDSIYAVEQYVGEEYVNYSHGTFVASTIQYGNVLNNIQGECLNRFKFLDVIALPNDDYDAGPVDYIQEDDLMIIVEEVVKKYHDKVKVWNLSLGFPKKICDGSMSDIGVFCDYIQDTYNVQFIISSGNFLRAQREWPPQEGIGESDRIIAPSDSVRALTVGSIALHDSPNSVVKINEPSPFSRRGPGANFAIKPEVVDYGGNKNNNRTISGVGIIGLDAEGKETIGVGTSYAAPRVVRKFANILEELSTPDIALAKALLIHSANINMKMDYEISREDIKYYGFGVPSDKVNDFMLCNDNEITLVFQQSITPGTHLELIDFPYPKSLIKNGKCTGEVFMTLVYNPDLDAEYGSEYCRSNIDVSFGTYTYKEDGSIKFKGQVPLEKNWDSKFEKEQVENGFKWNPIKSYYKKFARGIDCGEGWKLRIDMSPRYNATISSQKFTLIITIKDTTKTHDIYSDVVVDLRNKGYVTNDLQIKSQIRQRQ